MSDGAEATVIPEADKTQTKKERIPLANVQSPNDLIAIAIERDIDLEKLEKLLELRERWEKAEARKAFVAAMAAFKREAPSVLPKDATVYFETRTGQTSYTHATLGSITNAITPALSKNGLSVSWETEQSTGSVKVICHVTHSMGHRETTALAGPPDNTGSKNVIQQIGSTVTYLQRYTMLAALGLATADDNDGGANPKPPAKVTQPRAKPAKGKGKGKPAAKTPAQGSPATAAADEDQGAEGDLGFNPEDIPDVLKKPDVSGCMSAVGLLSALDKKPTNAGKDRWTLCVGDIWYGTFSESMAEYVSRLMEATVTIFYRESKGFKNLAWIEEA